MLSSQEGITEEVMQPKNSEPHDWGPCPLSEARHLVGLSISGTIYVDKCANPGVNSDGKSSELKKHECQSPE